MATSTITNTVKDPAGNNLPGVRVVARIHPHPAFRTVAGSEIAPVVEAVTDSNGQWSLALERTADITPSNTYYEIIEYTPDQRLRHLIQVGSSDQSLFAALITVPPAGDLTAYLTQAAGDARYQALGALGGTAQDVAAAASNGSSSSAARADHVHKLPNGLIVPAMHATGYRPTYAGTAAPSSPAEGDLWVHKTEKRLYLYDGAASQRVGHYAIDGRTGVSVSRVANQAIGNGTEVLVSWDTEVSDSDAMFAPTSAVITCKVPGTYGYDSRYLWSAAPSPGNHGVRVNGTQVYGITPAMYSGVNATGLQGFLALALDDTVEFVVVQNSGSSKNLTGICRLVYLGR